jgi:hypothetical protein
MVFLLGGSLIVVLGGCNTVFQTVAQNNMRGRVMAIHIVAVFGLPPIGSLAVGWGSEIFGLRPTLCVAGVLCLLGSLQFGRYYSRVRASIRPIYVKLGIIVPSMEGSQLS